MWRSRYSTFECPQSLAAVVPVPTVYDVVAPRGANWLGVDERKCEFVVESSETDSANDNVKDDAHAMITRNIATIARGTRASIGLIERRVYLPHPSVVSIELIPYFLKIKSWQISRAVYHFTL